MITPLAIWRGGVNSATDGEGPLSAPMADLDRMKSEVPNEISLQHRFLPQEPCSLNREPNAGALSNRAPPRSSAGGAGLGPAAITAGRRR
jgi:hypothetical protein